MWKKYNHIIITIVLVAIAIPFEFEIYTLLILSGFWFGREHSQAEYRYMKLKGINRSKLGFFDGFKKEAWDMDSFVNDLVLPITVGLLIIGVIIWQ
ncbi:MAG: hypothetical protein ACMV1B_09075 [Prevotella sp.]